MFKEKKILCVIPCRSGSKGLPGKNIKMLLGRPLMVYSIEQARKSRYVDRVVVSTDDPRIAKIAVRAGAEAPFLRPKPISTDKSSVIDALLHAIAALKEKEGAVFDAIVLLHANAPLRNIGDIDKCIELLFTAGTENVFSVTPAQRNPYFNMVEIGRNSRVKLVKKGNFNNRQDAPSVFDLNSSIYAWKTEVLTRKRKVILGGSKIYIMPKERSVDIDDYLDFKLAELLMRKARKR